MTIPAGFGQFALVFTGVDVPNGAVMTCGFENSLNLSAEDCADTIAAAVSVSAINDLWVATTAITTVKVKLGPDATGPTFDRATLIIGTQIASACPPQVSLLIQKRTPFGGRKNRGRFYQPALDEADITSAGQVSGGTLPIMAARYNSFHANLVGSSVAPYVLHGDLTGPTEITSFAAQTLVATQRRRLRP